jgi:hypothetical protein
MSKWSHLPNAKYIDRIIADAKANPTAWAAGWVAYDAAWDAAWSVARESVYAAARGAVRDAALDAAWSVARDAAVTSVRDAVLALVAWDYAGDLMDLPADQVKVLAILGDQAAILLYPAIAIMETTQELV